MITRRTVPLLLLLIALVAVAGTAANARTASAGSNVVGHVYVNDNTVGVNTIAGFDRHPDGSLSPIPGSPFAAGGAGTGTPTGSQGALQQSSDGRYLLAVDAGSNQLSVLRILPGGSLQLASVQSSNGTGPISIAVHGSLVYVANSGAGGSNYTGFTLNSGGKLTPIPGSTFALPDTAQPGDVLFSGDGMHLAGARVASSMIDSFDVGPDGLLTASPGSPFAAQGVGPFGSEFRPGNSSQLFVSNAHNGAGLGTVSAFDVAASGALTSVAGSPFADGQTAPCWVEISHDGTVLFTVNTATPSISSYSIASNGALTLLGSTPFHNPTGLSPFDARLDPTGSFLYVVDGGVGKVSVFAVSGGTLTEQAWSPVVLPAGATPFGIVVN